MLEFTDELVQVGIKDASGNVNAVSIDCLELRLLCQSLEQQYNLRREGTKVFATREFLTGLREQLKSMGINCSTNIAYQLWARLADIEEGLKKNTDSTPTSQQSTESTPTN
jgi:hypothetical protein